MTRYVLPYNKSHSFVHFANCLIARRNMYRFLTNAVVLSTTIATPKVATIRLRESELPNNIAQPEH